MRVRITYFDLRQEVLDLLDLDYDADTSMWHFQVIGDHVICSVRYTAADVKVLENLDASEP